MAYGQGKKIWDNAESMCVVQPPRSTPSLPELLDRVIRLGYTALRPNHLKLEDYCTSLHFRLLSARRCLDLLQWALAKSDELPDEDLNVTILKESESCIFFLSSVSEVLGHILNLCCKLGLPEQRVGKKSPPPVSIHSAIRCLVETEKWKATLLATYLKEKRDESWFEELKHLRDQITHRQFLEYEFKRGSGGRAQAFIKNPVAKKGSFEVSRYLPPLLEAVERFIHGTLSRLLVLF